MAVDGPLADLTPWFESGTEIGRGAYSVVRRLEIPTSPLPVAVKKVPKTLGAIKPREVVALDAMPSHPNVVAFVALYHDPTSFYVACRYEGESMTLMQMIVSPKFRALRHAWFESFTFFTDRPTNARSRCMHSRAALVVMRQLAVALRHCHQYGVAHRDLSLANILIRVPPAAQCIDDSCQVILIDFQLCHCTSVDGRQATTHPGTAEYCAPEVLAYWPYDPFPSDVWAFAVVAHLLLCGFFPFCGGSTPAGILALRVAIATIDPCVHLDGAPGLSPRLIQLLRDCMNKIPDARPSFGTLVLRITTLSEHFGGSEQ